MPNIKSAKKRLKQSEKRYERNKQVKSALKTTLKKAEEALSGDDKAKAFEALKTASKKLDSTAQKKTIHPRKAARKKSRLAKKFNKKFS